VTSSLQVSFQLLEYRHPYADRCRTKTLVESSDRDPLIPCCLKVSYIVRRQLKRPSGNQRLLSRNKFIERFNVLGEQLFDMS
jgi:hypothetical protein